MNKKIITTILAITVAGALFTSCGEAPVQGEPDSSRTPPTTVYSTDPFPLETFESDPVQEEVTETVPSETEPEVDITAPFFLQITRDASIALGEQFDIHDYLSYADDLDDHVDIYVEGDVDTTQTGSYVLGITLTDDAGNSVTDQITVSVYEPADPSSGEVVYTGGPTTEGATPFETFISSYPGDLIWHGIDVSHWQGDIDWPTVAASHCEFAMIRTGWSAEGQFHEDDYFRTNIEGATAAGIPVGVYVYTSDNNVEDVVALADTVCDLCDGYDLTLPIAFDWESFSKFQQYDLSLRSLNSLYTAFASRVEERGYECTLYGSKYYLDVMWEDDDIDPVWLAHFASQTDYEGDYLMWQQSCSGSIPGIDAYVDLDLYYGDLGGSLNG